MNSEIIIKGTLLQPLLEDSSPYQQKTMPLELFCDSYVSRLHFMFFLTSMIFDIIINRNLLQSLLKDSSASTKRYDSGTILGELCFPATPYIFINVNEFWYYYLWNLIATAS